MSYYVIYKYRFGSTLLRFLKWGSKDDIEIDTT